jgi:WD40 repeat protein
MFSGHTSVKLSLALSLDGTLLVSGSKDEAIKLWDVQIGGATKIFSGHVSVVSSVSISSDPATIVSGSAPTQ